MVHNNEVSECHVHGVRRRHLMTITNQIRDVSKYTSYSQISLLVMVKLIER